MSVNVTTPQGITAGSWKVDPVHSLVGFAVKHMGVSTFRGRFDDYDGDLVVEDGKPRLEGLVRMASVVVGDENLAGHLASPDFFDTERFPEIRFVSSDVRVADVIDVGGAFEEAGDLAGIDVQAVDRKTGAGKGQRQRKADITNADDGYPRLGAVDLLGQGENPVM